MARLDGRCTAGCKLSDVSEESWVRKMKNKIILGIILIVILLGLSGCSTESEAETEKIQNRLVRIYRDYNYQILVDTRTNVEYMSYHGAGGLIMLVNQDGTPLLYGGE